MSRIVFCIALLFFSATAAAVEPPRPEVVRVGQRVFALLGLEELPDSRNRGLIGNSTLIVGDKGAILIDSGFSHELGGMLRDAAAKITPKPITHVINTHAHGDHFLGNSAFPGAEIISSEKCRKTVETEGRAAVALIEKLTGIRSPNTKPVPASRTFAEGTKTELTINGVRMVLWVPNGSHTPGDLLVFLPNDGVLVAGDVLANGVVPNLADSDAGSWLKTLDEMSLLKFETAIAGHGRPMRKTDVAGFSQRLLALYAGIEAGYKEGLSDSEVREKLDLSEWQQLRRFDEMGIAINRIYLEVEKKNF
jgi:cyclase